MHDYILTQSKYIETNQQAFIDQCLEIKDRYELKDTTKEYYRYNIFSLSAGSIYFYNLFLDLTKFIRHQIPNHPLWLQAWVNIHKQNEVLDWHNHYWPYHGYISIDPKHTVTEFDNYSITNKIGQIYFGPGNRFHKVRVESPYDNYRITIGYDVTDDPMMHTGCIGFIPIVR